MGAADSDRVTAERRALTSRAGVVALGTLASRILGLGRDLVLAAAFSRGATDAFMVAFTIPNTLRQLLAEGAVQTAVLPVLAKTREQEGPEAARRFFAAARGVSIAALLAVSVLGVLFAGQLVDLFAVGFRSEPGQSERTATLTRWLFPYIFFMGTAAFGSAALNSEKRFVVTAFAPGLLNVACIACALLLPGTLVAHGEDPILSMAFGALLGGVLQVVAQWPSLIQVRYFDRPTLSFAHPGVREALRRMGPVVAGLGIYLMDVVVARRFLSELGVGAQTYFGFALRLCDFPQGIFVMAIQTAALPSLAALSARGDREALESTYAFGVRLTLFVAIAATALFVFLAEPIVALLFQRGEFDAVATHETARALVAQGLGIWTVAIVRQLLAVYFAIGDTRTPVVVSLLDFGAFIALALVLRGPLGHVGIGYAVAGSSAVQMLLLWTRLRSHLGSLRLREIGHSATRTLGASLLAGGAGWLVAGLTEHHLRFPPALGHILPGAAGATAFLAVYLGVSHAAGSEELAMVLSSVRRRRRT
ncbi:MAG TPA: murein biosynthesis integral membrane protein MurJ [Polyangiaceae bacterium]|nr:murein biosynthesis integral membrane protein MurJ [Polyangiaceae bacterium]